MTGPTPATGHMPFAGHRTQQEVREDEVRREMRLVKHVRGERGAAR